MPGSTLFNGEERNVVEDTMRRYLIATAASIALAGSSMIANAAPTTFGSQPAAKSENVQVAHLHLLPILGAMVIADFVVGIVTNQQPPLLSAFVVRPVQAMTVPAPAPKAVKTKGKKHARK